MTSETPPPVQNLQLRSPACWIHGALCMPLIRRGIGRRLITDYVIGGNSGRGYAILVAYTAPRPARPARRAAGAEASMTPA